MERIISPLPKTLVFFSYTSAHTKIYVIPLKLYVVSVGIKYIGGGGFMRERTHSVQLWRTHHQ